jgi:AmmeMemoRadiSam system protein B
MVESTPGEAEKRLAMPSFKTIETDFGPVKANERLRNDFADEDDDFFINDNAFDKGSTLYQQLPVLQTLLDNFSILHIQISDEGPPIIKELAMALQEILPARNALLVCCCDLRDQREIDQITNLIENGNISGLLNKVYRKELNIEGFGPFLTGLLVANKWGLSLHFDTDSGSGSVYSGYAVVENQPIFG